MKKSFRLVLIALALAGAPSLRAATISLFAGGVGNGAASGTVPLADPFAVGFDAKRNLAYLCEMTNNRVLMSRLPSGKAGLASVGKKGSAGDGGSWMLAEFNGPHHLLVAQNGDVFVADTFNGKVRCIDAQTMKVSTFAGTGQRGYSGDGGMATNADFSGIYSLAFDAGQENLFLADLENRRVRAINMITRKVRLVAGNGAKGVPADGSDALTSPLLDPRAVAMAKNGDLYILERSGHALRVVDAKGKIRTVVGTGKPGGVTPTTNPLEATLKGPKHLCVDQDDNVLIADSENCVIRKYLPRENKLLLIAGTGKQGRGAVGGDPLKTELNHPHGVSVDAAGRIYICDSYNGRVLRIDP